MTAFLFNAMRAAVSEPVVNWSLPEEIGYILLRQRDWRWLGLRSRLVRVPVYREPTISVALSTSTYLGDEADRPHNWPVPMEEIGVP